MLHILFAIVVCGWLAFFATSPKTLKRVHKITAGAPLYFSHQVFIQVGSSFQMHGGFSIGTYAGASCSC